MTRSQTTTAQKQIKRALTVLLSEKGLQSLTVSDLTRRANVSRGTFYLHYTDKFDLMRSLTDATIDDLSSILREPDNLPLDTQVEVVPRATVVKLLEYIRSDITFIQALTGPNGDSSLAERFKTIVIQDVRLRLQQKRSTERFNEPDALAVLNAPQEYLEELLLSPIVSSILLWVRRGAVESPDQIADLITATRTLSPLDLLNMTVTAKN